MGCIKPRDRETNPSVKLKAAVTASSSWEELQNALWSEGFELKPKGGVLSVQSLKHKDDVCKASELGCAYSRLIKRFGAGFPSHPHEWLVAKVLGGDDDSVIE